MGYLSAVDMLDNTDIDNAIRWHMKSNCYPPIPDMMFNAIKKAIQLYNDYDQESLIGLPEGVSFRGRDYASVLEIMDGYRLEAFIDRY